MPARSYDLTMTGKNLRALRQSHGWTQAELAAKVPCSISTISALERGERDMSVETFFALCRALQCDTAALLNGQ